MTIENEQLIEQVQELYEQSDAEIFKILHQVANIVTGKQIGRAHV